MQLFFTTVPLFSFALNLFKPISRTTLKTQSIIVTTDQYSKLTWSIPTSETKATNTANNFINHWLMRNNKPTHLLTDNRTHFTMKFVETMRALFGFNEVMKTASYLSTNGHVKKFRSESSRASVIWLQNIKKIVIFSSNYSHMRAIRTIIV